MTALKAKKSNRSSLMAKSSKLSLISPRMLEEEAALALFSFLSEGTKKVVMIKTKNKAAPAMKKEALRPKK